MSSAGAPAAKKAKGASAAAAAAMPDDRRSGRLRTKVRVRSVIDPETRRQVALARLAALEQDNYDESAAASAAAAAGDAAYEDEEEEEVEQGGSKGKKRKRPTAGSRGAASVGDAVAPASAGKGADRAAKAVVHRTRNLDYVIAEEEYDSDGVNYKTIAAVCGFFGSYTCPRCGLRFCSLRCQHTHKETRCVKFSE